ncbi:MAG: cell division protein ZipA C-terminal FtsZ-binding domain-containing protein [Pseudomonadota bacterium]|nr:cell division protein ZipA C-terminal FtsZ-binding domain-containing protein [Pseudomonadota bacterium]
MSSLQVGLAVAGGLILGGVIAYNTWNTRRNEPRQAEPEPDQAPPRRPAAPSPAAPAPARDDDSGFGPSARLEPAFDPDFDDRTPPTFATTSTLALTPLHDRTPGLDALIDVIVPLHLYGHQVSGDAVLAALPVTRRVGSKPLAVEGREEVIDPWEHPTPGARYQYLQAGVQLANRTGALNEIEYSEFVMKIQALADALGATPEFGDMLHEVARARELDQFASQHDAQLGFVLRARHAAWSPGYVHQHAGRLGFVPGVIPGRMVLPSPLEGMPPVLSLFFDAQAALADDPARTALREVSLSLDVPQVPRGLEPFARLREVAEALARSMDGVITDDTGKPLQPQVIDAIGADLVHLYTTLESHDLAAGSPQARRLFS